VIAIVTHENAGPLDKGEFYVQRFLAGPEVDHYHQAVAVVVAATFEQARAAAQRIRVDYVRSTGSFDLAAQKDTAPRRAGSVWWPHRDGDGRLRWRIRNRTYQAGRDLHHA
jgi:xanthine dehydrogenase YagR molybdenum-binding subunit